MRRGVIPDTPTRSSSVPPAAMRWPLRSSGDIQRRMRALILLHRWLGILFCLLFAMWFASGIIMHFVPFPSLKEAERIDGLAPIDLSQVVRSPAEAVRASGIRDATRVRLLQRSDGPAYLVSGASGLAAFRAGDVSRAALAAGHQALAVALGQGQRRGMDGAGARGSRPAPIDRWTASGGLHSHHPL